LCVTSPVSKNRNVTTEKICEITPSIAFFVWQTKRI
jgi:hypothetical protein